MPYITTVDKHSIELNGPTTPGQLNYAITKLLIAYADFKGTSYATMNDILGVLEGAKLEFARRKLYPLEDLKKMVNGDVY